ncbi:MAG: NAD(P)H-hydrate epimerase, partial [Rhizobiaceae bacterium]
MHHALLTPEQMSEADRLTISSGITGSWLMENAGHAVMDVVLKHYPEINRAVVLCGPGNNGGDGYVVARLMRERGVPTVVYCRQDPKPHSDAALACIRWRGETRQLETLTIEPADVVIDALYGAGFRGTLESADAQAAQIVAESNARVIAVDLPSGIDGVKGTHQGQSFASNHTVTFFCKKPGHLLYPARALCGQLHVANIGISTRVLREIKPTLFENGPALFESAWPKADPQTHKYARGAIGVFSGGAGATGAARLSALSAAKAGAGAVIMFATTSAVADLSAHLTSAMIRTIDNPNTIPHIISDRKYAALVIGPGFGDLPRLRETVATLLQSSRPIPLVLDADVFSAFADDPQTLFAAIQKSSCPVVLTPHEGEFQRLFTAIANTDMAKHEKARAAATLSHATVIYKGPDTIIAAPDG